MPIQPRVAVILLNYNGRSYLERFLPFLKTTTYVNKKIYVIDNGSEDDSIAFLENEHPETTLIRNEKNLGYAGGYNKGLSHIDADYFILLNTDVEVSPAFIEPMVTLLEKDHGIGICQPKILSLSQKDRFEYAGGAGGWIDSLGYTFARGRIFESCEEDRGQYDADSSIFWASGACMFIRASLFRELEGFYAYYFMYSEEVDLCWRAQTAGYKVVSCGSSKVYHKDTPPLSSTPRRVFYIFRNNLIMLHRNTPVIRLAVLIPLRLLLNIFSLFRFLLKGNIACAAHLLAAHLAFLKWLLFIKKGRKNRKTALSDLKTAYQGSIIIQYFLLNKKKFGDIQKRNS